LEIGREVANPPHLRRDTDWTLERRAIPAARFGRSRIGGREKVEQHGVGIGSLPNHVIGQDELTESLVVESPRGYGRITKTLRLGIGIRIERRLRKSIAAGPEARAADLVRIGFARDRIRQAGHAAGMLRRPASGKARHGEIEAAPEEMHRARFVRSFSGKRLSAP
jgi:hypothetical protein